jgi:hypothetical protein
VPELAEPVLQPIAEQLRDWKHAKRITIDVAEASLTDVMQHLAAQTGLRFSSFHNQKTVSLKLKDEPLWKALAETSIQADLPIWVFDAKEIKFSSITGYVFKRYQIIGPFLVGVHWLPTLLTLEDDSQVPGIVISSESLPNEGRMTFGPREFSGLSKATLVPPDGETLALKQLTVQGTSSPHCAFFVVPKEALKENRKLRAKFECDVYTNPKEFVVPAVARRTTKFEDFGGIEIAVEQVNGESVEYAVTWDTKLRGADLEKAEAFRNRAASIAKGTGLRFSEAELRQMEAWPFGLSARARDLSAVENQLLDKNRKALKSPSYAYNNDLGSVRGEISHEKGAEPAELKLVLAERRLFRGFIEFDDVFSADRK